MSKRERTTNRRIGVFSDVHGNVDALDAVLARYSDEGVDRLYCLGDTVGYGGDPQRCCELVREHAIQTVTGNHDAAVAGVMNYDYYYDGARNALTAHRSMLNEEALAWLRSLPLIHRDHDDDLLFSHGSPSRPQAYEYIFDVEQVELVMDELHDLPKLSFIGHSHLTCSFRFRREGEEKIVEEIESSHFSIEEEWSYIITVGSVGQPRDRDARARAVVVDLDAATVEFLFVDYDIAMAAERILGNAALPSEFAKRLFLGV